MPSKAPPVLLSLIKLSTNLMTCHCNGGSIHVSIVTIVTYCYCTYMPHILSQCICVTYLYLATLLLSIFTPNLLIAPSSPPAAPHIVTLCSRSAGSHLGSLFTGSGTSNLLPCLIATLFVCSRACDTIGFTGSLVVLANGVLDVISHSSNTSSAPPPETLPLSVLQV